MVIKIALGLFWIISLCIGLFLFFKPSSAIKFQQNFYIKINWRIEPVSYSKEIRNTRIMGAIILLLILLSLIFLFGNL
ncbi:MAG: hypothetical protein N2Z79_03630 [Candidatus Omnitrophica bacterium]|nr:hypothetical protein [Candidatus Omnitrophota bacterium]